MNKISTTKKTALIGFALILAASAFPRKLSVASAYDVTVSDVEGRALAGVTVVRYIQDFSSGWDLDHSVEGKTDANGRVSFPGESHRMSLAREAFGCAKQILSTGAHASCGSFSDISVSNSYLIEAARAELQLQNDQRSLKLIMSPCPSGNYWACTGRH